jgi:hypothetical protein
MRAITIRNNEELSKLWLLGDVRVNTKLADDGVYLRTAIVVAEDETESIDIITEDGEHVCRLNISAKQDLSWANIDVIKVDEGKIMRAIGFANGRLIIDVQSEETVLMAVEIKDPPQETVEVELADMVRDYEEMRNGINIR